MKKLVYSLPSDLFELFLIEFNGYGYEILNRDNNETFFAIYAEDQEVETVKEAVEEIFKDLGNGKIILEEDVPEINWEEEWKKGFNPIKVPPFILIPEWEIYTENDLIPIKLKVGMAFGTGRHPTTQIALSFIAKYVNPQDTVLDAGCGSGVLSIAAAKLGAAKVEAIDIHKEAIEECKTNAWENEVKISCQLKDVKDVNEKYDVIIANIQMDVFENVFDKLASLFEKYLIISGIYKEKEKEKILALSEKNNLKLIDEKSMPESDDKLEDLWYGFVFKHS
jgi:ribosomal protein L11 methyltransferase